MIDVDDVTNNHFISADQLADLEDSPATDYMDAAYAPGVPSVEFNSIEDIRNYKIKRVKDFERLQEGLANLTMKGIDCYYRGHSRQDYELKPTIGRDTDPPIEQDELDMLANVKREGLGNRWERFKPNNMDENLFFLSVARHMGRRCRLLDWSIGLFTAMSFLADDDLDKDGSLWVMLVKKNSIDVEQSDPLKLADKAIHLFSGGYLIQDGDTLADMPVGLMRRYEQNGIFTATSFDWVTKPLNEFRWENSDYIHFVEIYVNADAKRVFRDSPYYIPKDNRLS